VSLKSRLLTTILCSTLLVGAVFGINMRPDQIEDLLRQINQPKVARKLRETADADDGLPPGS
jgi:hypothetical protein